MIQVTFTLPPELDDEQITAFLYELGFHGFYVENQQMFAYIDEEKYNKTKLMSFFREHLPEVTFEVKQIEEKNWNALWELNFQPVFIEQKIYVRAPFHPRESKAEFEIVINPKMSFGTAHHPTTYGMLQMMINIDLAGKKVIDVGTGTGILAIFAVKKGASFVWACDVDDWSYVNAQENFELNNVSHIELIKGTIKDIHAPAVDVLLANITKNILLEEIPEYTKKLLSGGIMLLSGFLVNDLPEIDEKCSMHQLELLRFLKKEEWIIAEYVKHD